MSARPSSPRKPKAEPQLSPDQAAYIHHCLESLVQRGVQTITMTEQVDDQGHTTSVETHRKRTDLPAGQINSWRRLLCKLAETGLLPDKDDPLYYPHETPPRVGHAVAVGEADPHRQNEGFYRALLLAPVERMPTYRNLYKRLLIVDVSPVHKWI